MTDEDRVLEIATRLMAVELANPECSGAYGTYAEDALNAAATLLAAWRSRTTPREQPTPDVSDKLLEQLVVAARAASNIDGLDENAWHQFDRACEAGKRVQRARAAQREG